MGSSALGNYLHRRDLIGSPVYMGETAAMEIEDELGMQGQSRGLRSWTLLRRRRNFPQSQQSWIYSPQALKPSSSPQSIGRSGQADPVRPTTPPG